MNHALDWLQFVLAPQMINGLSIGVAVVLMALGLTIIFGLLDVINMAHGEFYAIGAYLAVALLGLGLSFWWALVLTPLLMAVLGYATERGLIQRVFHSKDRHTLTLLLTFGVALLLEGAVLPQQRRAHAHHDRRHGDQLPQPQRDPRAHRVGPDPPDRRHVRPGRRRARAVPWRARPQTSLRWASAPAALVQRTPR